MGIDAEIVNVEWAQWLEQVFKNKDFGLTIVSHTEPMDIEIYARPDYYFGYDDPAMRALLHGLDATADEAERTAILKAAQERVAENYVNAFLFQLAKTGVADARIEGLWANSPTQANDMTAVAGRSRMLRYALRRLIALALSLVVASLVVFLTLQVVPGDPASYMLGLNASPETVAALRAELGLDAGPLARYLAWAGGMLTGDFGISYTYRTPVAGMVLDRLQVSLPLALMALALSTLIAFPVGIWAAARRGTAVDAGVMGATQLGVAVPNFWFAMLLVLVFAVKLRWVSAGGFPGWQAGLIPGLRALALPALALALPQASILARVMRSALIDTLGEDFIRTARAKGLTRGQALRRHALRNALIPVLTIIGLQFSFLLAGAIIIENVFFLPGLGRLVFQAISQRDLIVVQSVVMLLVFAVILVTYLVDLAYAVVDPRLRGR